MDEKCMLDIATTSRLQQRIKSFKIQCNFPEQASLVRCHNVLQSIKGRFEEIIPFSDAEAQDESWIDAHSQGFIRIGAWTFSAKSLENTLQQRPPGDILGFDGDFDLDSIPWVEISEKEKRKGTIKSKRTGGRSVLVGSSDVSVGVSEPSRTKRAVSFADEDDEFPEDQRELQELQPRSFFPKSALKSLFPFVDDPTIADEKEAPKELFDYSPSSDSSVSPPVSPNLRVPPQIPRYTGSSASLSPSRNDAPSFSTPKAPSYLGRDKFRSLAQTVMVSRAFEKPRMATPRTPSMDGAFGEMIKGGTPLQARATISSAHASSHKKGTRTVSSGGGGSTSTLRKDNTGIEIFVRKHSSPAGNA
jgi:hypothetical protein